jgi:hypothetical protein
MRTVLGFVLAPVAGAIAFALLVLAAYSDQHGAASILSAFHAGVEIAFAGAVVAGVPTHFILRPLRWGAWYGYAAAGLLLGCFAVAFRISLSAWDYGTSSGVHNVLSAITFDFLPYGPLGAITGVTTGLVFWIVARPDGPVTQPAS